MRILQYLGGPSSWGDVTPVTMREHGLGGRETALIQLSEHWAAEGHEVINFVAVDEPYREGAYYVSFKNIGAYLNNFGGDVLISWEESRLFNDPDILKNVNLKIIEMQVAHLRMSDPTDENVDVYAVLSPWAGWFLSSQDSRIDPTKIKVLPNGVDLNRYPPPQLGMPLIDPGLKFYYSSSPDRGLNHLLNLWPRLLDRFPNSTLSIAYGVESWLENSKWSHNKQAEAALDILEGLQQPGINYLGKIGQDELARIQVESHALLYPCDTLQPTETGCITVIEAGAAGSPAFITDCDCLGSEFAEYAPMTRLPFDPDAYVDTISNVINDPGTYEMWQQRGYELAQARSWDLISKQWIELFEEKLYASVN